MTKPPRRKTRSDRYQYLIVEKLVKDRFWEYRDLHELYDAPEVSEERLDELLSLDDQLFDLLKQIALRELTDNQRAIMSLSLDGMTQVEIADELGIKQPTVQKTLRGSWSSEYKKYYGGIVNKLRKVIHDSEEIKDLMRQMYLLKDNDEVFLPTFNRLSNTMFDNYSNFEKWIKE